MNRIALVFVTLLFGVSACKEKATEYDRAPLLENIGNIIIVPSYKTAHEKALALKNAVTAFTNNPDVITYATVDAAYTDAYMAWQAVEVFDFAKGEALAYSLNTFPTDTSKIESNIAAGSYNLQAATNQSAKGFAAIDYLLFTPSKGNIVNYYTTSANARKYLQDVADDVSSSITAAYDDWNTSHLNTFTSATSLDAGGSISILCNSWAQMIERTRRERVGNSLGYTGLISSGFVYPAELEGFYSNTSKELLVANLQASKNLFTGATGVGFDDYPQVKEASFQGVPLTEEIIAQHDRCIAAANAVSSDFKTALVTNKPQMEALFLEVKKLVVLIKVDMASAIGVTINYTDNDGD